MRRKIALALAGTAAVAISLAGCSTTDPILGKQTHAEMEGISWDCPEGTEAVLLDGPRAMCVVYSTERYSELILLPSFAWKEDGSDPDIHLLCTPNTNCDMKLGLEMAKKKVTK